MYDEEDLLPISMLPHYAYCPRRAALIHLEGVWTENRFTVEGRHLHERVHDTEAETRKDLRVVRGLRLRSLRLGLVGMADVVEFHQDEAAGLAVPGLAGRWRAMPVEYKRGKPKRDRSDEVQLCAQALCLEEMLGGPVEMGALYYATPRRRQDVPLDAGLRQGNGGAGGARACAVDRAGNAARAVSAQVRQLFAGVAVLAEGGGGRGHGDAVSAAYRARGGAVEHGGGRERAVKHLLNTLYITTQKSYLCREGETVHIRVGEETRLRVPIHTLGGIVCFGQVSCSPPLMQLCAENDVLISFLSEEGEFYARVQGAVSGNVLLRREQYRRADEECESGGIARAIVLAKIANSRSVLMRVMRDHAETTDVGAVQGSVDRLGRLLDGLEHPTPLDTVRGREGDAAHAYFAVFDHLITAQKDSFYFRERSRRPPAGQCERAAVVLVHVAGARCDRGV